MKPASCIGVISVVGVGALDSVIFLPLSSSLPSSILFFVCDRFSPYSPG